VIGRGSATRMKRGIHFVPMSGWADRKAAKASGSKRHPVGVGVRPSPGRRSPDRGRRRRRRGRRRGDARGCGSRGRRRSSRRPPAASRRTVRRSRRSPARRGRRGRRSSTNRCGAGPVRRRCCPSSLRSRPPRLGDEFSDGLLGVGEPSVGVEAGDGTLLTGGRVDDHGVFGGSAEAAGRGVGGALDDGPALGRAVGVDHPAAEAVGRSGGGRPRPPRCRRPASRCCRRRRDARGWPGCRRGVCPRS
jgi:hypothetical protein